ncbi:uncharacterized protein LOC130507370 [Raphanus sativus]|uniref:Uncharacterized protein LOC108820203 n=1 Tax=Raphanus sativus TaxID=3726 RepID=A0A6J0KLD8_RAPSA|nr:uncharacterized protein LOC108820203 [Raphanus sativus]XP_056858068.1 uncharacterized protein LOC130507370 [Raphanus sativus]
MESGFGPETGMDSLLQTAVYLSKWYTTEVLEGDMSNFWVINTKQKNSWLANKLLRLRATAYDWIKHQVGNGERTYFWTSNWSPFGKIRDYLQGETTSSVGIQSTVTLAELWEEDHWVLPPARSESQVRIYTYLSTLQIVPFEDTMQWMPEGTPQQRYSTRMIYDVLRQEAPTVPWHKQVWFGGGIPKHSFRTWLMVLNRCPTRDRILQWGLSTDGNCLLCNAAPESRDHIYYACAFSSEVWINISGR